MDFVILDRVTGEVLAKKLKEMLNIIYMVSILLGCDSVTNISETSGVQGRLAAENPISALYTL